MTPKVNSMAKSIFFLSTAVWTSSSIVSLVRVTGEWRGGQKRRREVGLGGVVPPLHAFCSKQSEGKGQDCFSRFLGRPKGVHWADARARNASATKWGWDWIIAFQPAVSIMSAAWLQKSKNKNIHHTLMKWVKIIWDFY